MRSNKVSKVTSEVLAKDAHKLEFPISCLQEQDRMDVNI